MLEISSSSSFLYVFIRCTAFTLLVFTGVWGELVDIPADVTARLSENVRFNCSTDTNKQLSWQFGKRQDQLVDVYRAGEGFAKPYKTNRHSVDVSISGRCDLKIKTITRDDEGFYVCSEKSSLGDPPKAKLTVTGYEDIDDSCLKDSIAQSGEEVQYDFMTCKLRPYYIDHYPVGKSQAIAIWNKDMLVNDYATSGRFTVSDANGFGRLFIRNVQVIDAGSFRCWENAGLDKRHKKELIVIYSRECEKNYEFTSTSSSKKEEADCYIVTLVGHRDPLTLWKSSRCNGTSCSLSNVSIDSYNCTEISCMIIDQTSETTLVLLCRNVNKTCETSSQKNEEQGSNKWLVIGVVIAVSLCLVLSLLAVLYICIKKPHCLDKKSSTERVREPTERSPFTVKVGDHDENISLQPVESNTDTDGIESERKELKA